MDIGSYTYVLLVAALGMAIVFLFLWFLSGLMSLIRLLFGEREGQQKTRRGAAEEPPQPPPLALRGNNWIIAAVTAFLEAEQLDQSSDPSPWISGRAHHGDPWLTGPRES